MTKKSETKEVDLGTCPRCGAGLVNLPTNLGAVCPAECQGFWPPVPADASRRNTRAALVARLPAAARLPAIIATSKGAYADRGLYVLVQSEGGEAGRRIFRRIKRQSASLSKVSEGATLAALDGEAVEMVPFDTFAGLGKAVSAPPAKP